MTPKRKGLTKVPTPDPADQGEDDHEDTDKVDNDDVEMQDNGNSDHEHADEAFDERLARIIADMAINEEASSESDDDSDYDESEEGLHAQVETYRRRAAKKLYLVTLLNNRHRQAIKAVKALQLGLARERTELCKLDDARNAIRDDVKKQVHYLEDCIHDAERALKATNSLHDDDDDETQPNPEREAAKAVDDYVIKWDPADPVHAAIKAIYKIDHIPILPGTKTIDFSKLKHVELKNQPMLDIDRDALSTSKDQALLDIAKRVVKFKEDLKRSLRLHLTDALFDKVAWSYLPMSLVKIGLAKDYESEIAKVPIDERTWSKAIEALHKAIRFDSVTSNVADIVTRMRPERGESIRAFADRIVPLMEAADIPDSDCQWLVKPLGCYISDVGRQATLKKYGSLDKVNSVKAYLEFLHETPGAVEGNRTDHMAWFLSQFKADVITASSGSGTAPKQGQANRRDDPPQRGRSKSQTSTRSSQSSRSNHSSSSSTNCWFSDACKNAKTPHHYKDCRKRQAEQDAKKIVGNARKHSRSRSRSQDRSRNDRRNDNNNRHNGKGDQRGDAKARANRDNDRSNGHSDNRHHKVVAAFDRHDVVHMRDDTEFDKDEHRQNYLRPKDLKKVYEFKLPRPGDNRLVVPCQINGIMCTALLDPGATISLLSRELATDAAIRFGSIPDDFVALISTGTLVPDYVTCDRVQLMCNKKSLEVHLHVMDFDYFDVVIGMDLFALLGFTIGGIRLKQPRREDFLWVPTDEKPPIIPRKTPEVELTPEFIAEKAEFMRQLQPYLDENAKIDPTSHCTLPSMVVELKVGPDCKVQERPRQFYSQTEKDEVDKTVKQWLKDGVIVRVKGHCPYNSTLTMAARRDLEGKILKHRVCLDPRTLNKQLLDTDQFPLPKIADLHAKVAGKSRYSTFDLSQAYHRMKIKDEHQLLTAFTYNNQQYKFARAPFGLKPLTSIFQRGMAELFGDVDSADNYVDDILTHTDENQSHLEHCITVVKRLTEAKLIINQEKCNFYSTEILMLGYIVNRHGRMIDPKKIANIYSWAYPRNKKMVQRYLGLFNYFREYIPKYSVLAAPLEALRNKRGTFSLTKEERRSFDKLRRSIILAPCLSFPDFSLPFYVATDASGLGIGAVLYQLPNGDESKINFISFQARALHKSEKNYPAYKKELLGIVFALNRFHQYLWGRKFTLYTDHRPLTYIHEQKELPQIITNWKETIFNYDFDCIYRPGILNVIPDALSRAFNEEDDPNNEKEDYDMDMVPDGHPIVAAVTRALKAATIAEKTTPRDTSPGPDPDLPELEIGTGFVIDEAYVHQYQSHDVPLNVVLREEEKELILRQTHEFGHPGTGAMVNAIHRTGKTWTKLKEDCLKWVSGCTQCQYFNIARKGYHPLKSIHARLPGEHVAVDLAEFDTSTSGNKFVLVTVDICTRFVFLEPLPNKEAQTIARALFKLFCGIGFPKIVQSDNGTEFVNAICKLMNQKLKIDHRLSTPYHPRSNGVAERFVRTMKDNIKKQLEGRRDQWDIYIPMAQLQLNTRAASLHNSTPFSLFYGRSFANLTDFSAVESHLMSDEENEKRLEYLTNLVFPAISAKSTETQKVAAAKFNRSHRIRGFQPGTYVMAKEDTPGGKFDAKYHGPYKVLSRSIHGSYTLLDPMSEKLPRQYSPEQLKQVTQALDAPSDESYEIEMILDHSLSEGGVLYTVKWKGYDSSHNQQLRYDQFDSKAIIDNYWKSKRMENPHAAKRISRIRENKEKKLQKQKRDELTATTSQANKRHKA